jgi:steroid delta-isomerase-like uncharacterized protein
MSVEQNKATMRRVFEDALSKGNLQIIPELIAPDYQYRSPLGMEAKGPEGFKQMVITFRTAFPDLHIHIDNMIAEGDNVALHYTMSGTFRGEMAGMAPTGKQFSIPGFLFVKLAGGKELKAIGGFDMLDFYRQLGISIPPST